MREYELSGHSYDLQKSDAVGVFTFSVNSTLHVMSKHQKFLPWLDQLGDIVLNRP